eukprot:scpid114262/ scgid16023/ 
MMKDSRNYMTQGAVNSTTADPTRPIIANTTNWQAASASFTLVAHYRIFNAACYASNPPATCEYAAISTNASYPTALTFGDYEVLLQGKARSGAPYITAYVTPPLRL